MVFPVWLDVLVVLALANRRELGLARLDAIATAAFVLVALSYVVAYLQAPADLEQHQRAELVLTREGRVVQERWVFAHSAGEGIRQNIVNGLTAFNSDHIDEAFIYPNRGHGIVDPLTRALLWLGAATVLVRAIRRKGEPWNLVPLVAFLVLWLAFSFLVGQAPDYPRMLIVLPFVAYLVTEGIRLLAGLARLVPRPELGRLALSSDQRLLSYHTWGTPDIWTQRLQLFARNDGQIGGVIDPTRLPRFSAPPPFVIFMRGELWNRVKNDFERRYGHVGVHQITPDGLHLAVGVRRA